LWLLVLLATSTVARLALSWTYLGFLTGDDVEILEAGLDPVVGLGYLPWEIRNLLLPRTLVTPVTWLAVRLGWSEPTFLVRIAALPFIALGTLNIYLVYGIFRRSGSDWRGLLAAAIYAFHWLPLGFGATVYPRTASTTCVLGAFVLLLARSHDVPRGVAAGSLVALAFAVRYSEVIYLAPLAVAGWALGLGLRRSLARAAALLAGFVLGGVLFVGGGDLWTWGEPFHSLWEFARYTLVERHASAMRPTQPLLWYLLRAQFWLIPTLLPFLVTRKGDERAGAYWWMFVLPILALSLIHHKDMRYLQGVIPFLALLVAGGVSRWWKQGWRKTTVVLLMVSALFSLRSTLQMHRKKSLAAVQAALEIRRRPALGSGLVIQAWAYGDRLFFPSGTTVINFETPPGPARLRRALAASQWAALYDDDLLRDRELVSVLSQSGFERAATYRVARSRPVSLFVADGRAGEEGPARPSP
jgi:hypothetical protein